MKPYDTELSPALLKQLILSLKPNGKIVYQISATPEGAKEIESRFKLAGFVGVVSESSPLDQSTLFKVLYALVGYLFSKFEAAKPAYEVGASMKLSFKKKAVDTSKVSLWETAEDELLNEDDLLEEEDLSKPSKDSLASNEFFNHSLTVERAGLWACCQEEGL